MNSKIPYVRFLLIGAVSITSFVSSTPKGWYLGRASQGFFPQQPIACHSLALLCCSKGQLACEAGVHVWFYIEEGVLAC